MSYQMEINMQNKLKLPYKIHKLEKVNKDYNNILGILCMVSMLQLIYPLFKSIQLPLIYIMWNNFHSLSPFQ